MVMIKVYQTAGTDPGVSFGVPIKSGWQLEQIGLLLHLRVSVGLGPTDATLKQKRIQFIKALNLEPGGKEIPAHNPSPMQGYRLPAQTNSEKTIGQTGC